MCIVGLSIKAITLLVHDYDEAIAYYGGKLGFKLLEDTPLAGEKRWVRMAPSEESGFGLLLAKAATSEQREHVGNQTGGRVFLFLETDDFWSDYNLLNNAGIHFIEQPRQDTYGWVVVFIDIYGNKWDLVESNHD
jgi:catechol 2,3-dioxygenase-like lactoylglutathione lyase family enzyme